VLYPPNRDAIGWFTDTVLPAVRARVPGAELYVSGAHGPDPPRAEGLVYTGRLPDVHAAIAGAMISVVPLRLGAGGARFKVIESMALGTPVVATSIGVEGLELVDGVDYLRAQTAEAISDACVALLTDRARRDRISASARRRIETDYNWVRLSSEIETQIARRMDTLSRAA
jgi:glycosyltransferase involved in cell wall biosynthesis